MSYNRVYHRHFEGYVERVICDPDTGRTHIQRIYAGPYYRHALEDKAWVKLKVKYALLFLWSAVCLFVQGFNGCTGVWYLAVPAALGLIAMACLGFTVASYICNSRELELHQYRDRELLEASAIAGMLVFLLLLAGQFAWMVLSRYVFLYGVICIVTDASASAALFLLFWTERNTDYVRRENQELIPKGSYDIHYKDFE